MKRERQHNVAHRFSFGERFDEKMLNVHSSGGQRVMSSIHQFIGFSPLNKSAGKATVVNTAIRRLVGRTSILPTGKEKPSLLAKKERHPKAADTAAGFWETKSHSSLGRFLHAPPLWTPRLLLLEAAGCPLEHSKGWVTLKSNLCFSMVASLCFGQTKTNSALRSNKFDV